MILAILYALIPPFAFALIFYVASLYSAHIRSLLVPSQFHVNKKKLLKKTSKSKLSSTSSSSLTPTSLNDGPVLFVIAHPDDECMFFAPTLLNLTSINAKDGKPQKTGINHAISNVHVLCLSNGFFFYFILFI